MFIFVAVLVSFPLLNRCSLLTDQCDLCVVKLRYCNRTLDLWILAQCHLCAVSVMLRSHICGS